MLRAERPRDRGFTSCKGESYVPSRKLSDRMWVALNRHVTVNAGYFLGDIAAEAWNLSHTFGLKWMERYFHAPMRLYGVYGET